MIDYENMCPICLNTFKTDSSGNHIDIGITDCNHKFCLTCIVRHGKRRNTCPMCRNEFLDPYNFSPRAFHSEEELIVANNMGYDVEVDSQGEIEVMNWYYGGEVQERMQEMPPPPPLIPPGVTINNVTFDPSNIHLNSNYFTFNEDYLVEEEEDEPEPEPESEPEPSGTSRRIFNEIYDETVSLSDSNESSSDNEL